MCRWTTQSIQREREEGGGRGIRGSQASRWRGEERREASRFFYGRPDGEIRKGGEPRMRIVGHASRMEKEIERRSRWFVIRGTEPGRSFLLRHSTRCTRLPDASRRQRLLQAPRVQRSAEIAPTTHKFRAGPKVVPVRGGISWMNLVDETGDLEREGIVEEIVVTGNFKNCSSYGIVNFLSLESRISEF